MNKHAMVIGLALAATPIAGFAQKPTAQEAGAIGLLCSSNVICDGYYYLKTQGNPKPTPPEPLLKKYADTMYRDHPNSKEMAASLCYQVCVQHYKEEFLEGRWFVDSQGRPVRRP